MKVLLSKIKPNPNNPRKSFDPVDMAKLEQSIKDKGIYNPLEVMETKKGEYVLIDGERRYRAALNLKLKEVPITVLPFMDEKEQLVAMFHIQEQTKSWNMFDRAQAIFLFMQQEKMDANKVAEMLGMHKTSIKNWLNILQLQKSTQERILKEKLPFAYTRGIERMAKKYVEIVDMPREKIEHLLFDKIQNKSIPDQNSVTRAITVIRSDGSEKQKIKFLMDPNYTVRNLVNETPVGHSIKVDFIIMQAQKLNTRIKQVKDIELTKEQEKVFENLLTTINTIV